jgi:glyoxylase-like metal-dependent hydrolase (beta-lactamase superfamily II)
MADNSPLHRIRAIRYARHDRKAAENFIGGDDHASDMPLDYYVWVIDRDGLPPIIVDCGFGQEAAGRRGRTMLRTVEAGLAEAGIDLTAVEDVILTHLHYDHAGSLSLFPTARFHIQDAEMAYATGRAMTHRMMRAPFDAGPVAEMVHLIYGDRVVFHAGSGPLAPGIALHHLGGHSLGLQAVAVATARGPVVLASDVAHLYANITRNQPFPIVADVVAYMESIRRLRALAPSLSHIIPGHDPLVGTNFPPDEARHDIVRVDLAPIIPIEEQQ